MESDENENEFFLNFYSVICIIFWIQRFLYFDAWYSNRWIINCKNVILPWLQICKESTKMVSNEWECNWIKYTHGKRKWMNVSRDCSTIISIIITIKDDKEATNYKSHSYVQMKLLFSVCSKYQYIWRWWFTDYVCSTAITLSKKLYIYMCVSYWSLSI